MGQLINALWAVVLLLVIVVLLKWLGAVGVAHLHLGMPAKLAVPDAASAAALAHLVLATLRVAHLGWL